MGNENLGHSGAQQLSCAVFAAFVLLIVGLVGYQAVQCWQADTRDRRHKIEVTQKLVDELTPKFDDDEDFFVKLDPAPKDAWGHPLKCETEKGAISYCTLVSAGPDGKFDTRDDIQETNHNFNTSKAGQAVGTQTGKFGGGFLKGLGKAVKEEFWDKKE